MQKYPELMKENSLPKGINRLVKHIDGDDRLGSGWVTQYKY